MKYMAVLLPTILYASATCTGMDGRCAYAAVQQPVVIGLLICPELYADAGTALHYKIT
jgi:hypothetical protein